MRQVAVDLSINPNTVVRAYRELEIRGVLETQQGTGTFISQQKVKHDEVERQRQLDATRQRVRIARRSRRLHDRGIAWSNLMIVPSMLAKRGDKAMRPDLVGTSQ